MQKASDNMAIPSNPVIGTKYQFGTLYVQGVAHANPTKPWRPDAIPSGMSNVGDIPKYASGGFEIGNSIAVPTTHIQWVYVGDNKYISDRNILSDVSWDMYNSKGFVSGKLMVLDGVAVKISLPSGGVYSRTADNGSYAGGTPTSNDWDQYIQNEAGLSGLPTPTAGDKDSGTYLSDYSGAHNQFWNWYWEYSFCKEVREDYSPTIVVRGYNAASYFTSTSRSNVHNREYGFRPVLEVLNTAPQVTSPPTDQSLGNKNAGFTQPYTVYDADGEAINVSVKLDGTEIGSYTNVASGTASSVAITGATWNGLALGAHTLTITVTDPNSATSTRTLTFAKVNTPPTAPVITGLAAGQRLAASGSVAFNASTDADGDTLSYTLQFASDSAFTADLQQFTGASSPISYSGVPVNTSRYVRVVVSDTKTTTAGSVIQVKIGNKLEFTSAPVNRSTMPVSARVMMDWSVAAGATYTIQLCNNANDAAPTWEDCTGEVDAGTAHTFTNASKTAAGWAVGLRVVINAGTATGAIEVRAFGFDIIVS